MWLLLVLSDHSSSCAVSSSYCRNVRFLACGRRWRACSVSQRTTTSSPTAPSSQAARLYHIGFHSLHIHCFSFYHHQCTRSFAQIAWRTTASSFGTCRAPSILVRLDSFLTPVWDPPLVSFIYCRSLGQPGCYQTQTAVLSFLAWPSALYESLRHRWKLSFSTQHCDRSWRADGSEGGESVDCNDRTTIASRA